MNLLDSTLALIAGVALVGCGGATKQPDITANMVEARPWTPTMSVAAADIGGWLASAVSVDDDDGPHWLPHDSAITLFVNAASIEEGTELYAVPPRGEGETVRAAAIAAIRYGCDGYDLTGQVLESPRMTPGAVWVLPTPLPQGWAPSPLEIKASKPSRERASWEIGPLTLVMTRQDDTHGTLQISAGDREIGSQPVEKYYMDGADEAPLDLAGDYEPGIPTPEAAFEIAPGGPVLLVFSVPGYEGASLTSSVVNADGVTETQLGTYFYRCAF